MSGARQIAEAGYQRRRSAFAIRPAINARRWQLCAVSPCYCRINSRSERSRQAQIEAKVKRATLFRNDVRCKRLRFHDLRVTGLTWMAIRGDNALKVQQRAGHTTFDMTQKYIRTAEAVGEVIGTVFPALPLTLLRPINGLANRPNDPQAR